MNTTRWVISLIIAMLLFTSCSRTTVICKDGVNKYYGFNFIDLNTSQDVSYMKIEGVGLIQSFDGITLGIVEEERIYANPRKCQAILIVNEDNVNLNNTIKMLENICVIRR